MDKQQFANELKEWIDKHKGHKFSNNDVDYILYDRTLERKNAGKRTNIKAITKLNKLVKYTIAFKMLDVKESLRDVDDYIDDLLGVSYRQTFKEMFDNIELETPEIRIIKNPVINADSKFYMIVDGHRIDLEYDYSIPVKYCLIEKDLQVNHDSWSYVNLSTMAPFGSIAGSVPIKRIEGSVILNKKSKQYELSNVKIFLDLGVERYSLVSRYSGLSNSAWVVSQLLNGKNWERFENKDWPGDPVKRGYAYLFYGNHMVSRIKCDWDGHYNGLTFDQALDLFTSII